MFHFIYNWWKFNCILPFISNILISLKLCSRLSNFLILKLSNNFLVSYHYVYIDSFFCKNEAKKLNNDCFLLIYICLKRKLTQNISDNAWLTKTKMTALIDDWSYCHSRRSLVLPWLRYFEAFTGIVKYHNALLISLYNIWLYLIFVIIIQKNERESHKT